MIGALAKNAVQSFTVERNISYAFMQRYLKLYTHETHASRSCPLVIGADISYQNTFVLPAGKISVNISDEIDCNTFLVSDSVTDSVIYNLLNRYAFFAK